MLTNTLSLNNTVVQKEGNIVSDMDGSKVMLSIEKGKYYNLGGIGGYIWGLMESPTKVKSIVKHLIDSYEVEHADCQEQVLNFISQLAKEGLIMVTG
jgi:hypothetical protein